MDGASYDALFTDLYELTMLQTYFAQGVEDQAVFSLFVRRLPERRNYLLACGLGTVLDYLEHLRFTSDEIAYLKSLGQFSDGILDRLKDFRFSGGSRRCPTARPCSPMSGACIPHRRRLRCLERPSRQDLWHAVAGTMAHA